jgi:hypothetical protein
MENGRIPSKFGNPIRDLVKIMINAYQLTKLMKNWIN